MKRRELLAGLAAASFMENVNWGECTRRYEEAVKTSTMLK
jgi:hypothetical protein